MVFRLVLDDADMCQAFVSVVKRFEVGAARIVHELLAGPDDDAIAETTAVLAAVARAKVQNYIVLQSLNIIPDATRCAS